MVRHFRPNSSIRSATPSEFVGAIVSRLKPANATEQSDTEADPSLDVLLKHAICTPDSAQPDLGRIWRQLSRRVVGPFGSLAVEGPASTGGGSSTRAFGIKVSRPAGQTPQHGAPDAGGNVPGSGLMQMLDGNLLTR